MRLTATELEVAHGRTTVLFGVSLQFDEGGSCCVLGRNGAGKTSLMNAIMGVLPVRRGRVLLDDREITSLSPWERVRAGIGYAPQERSGFGGLSVRRTCWSCSSRGGARSARRSTRCSTCSRA